jgi:hypothetical protein
VAAANLIVITFDKKWKQDRAARRMAPQMARMQNGYAFNAPNATNIYTIAFIVTSNPFT